MTVPQGGGGGGARGDDVYGERVRRGGATYHLVKDNVVVVYTVRLKFEAHHLKMRILIGQAGLQYDDNSDDPVYNL